MQWRKPHPWDGRYALPDNVMAEPPRFGTLTTAQTRRRTFGPLAPRVPGWQHGLALPSYVETEPIGREVRRTKYTPRKTIMTTIPDYLGDDEPPMKIVPGADNDPIAQFGHQVAAYIMSTIWAVPAAQRKQALKSLFDEMDPKLWGRVQSKAQKLQDTRDMGPMEALEKAIASAASLGLLEEFIRVGRGAAPKDTGLLGLGVYHGAVDRAAVGYFGRLEALGFCGPICAAKKVGSAIKSAGEWTGSKVKAGASTAYGWGKTALGKIGDLACKVTSSQAGQIAAGAGAAAAGAPPQVGAAGAQVVSGMCGSAPPPPPPMTIPGTSIPLIPIAIGGAALLTVALLLKD